MKIKELRLFSVVKYKTPLTILRAMNFYNTWVYII